jgi:pimeloyl-ACP methyl ester carboxylesterase
MKDSEWVKPGILGAIVGAIGITVIGFSWGGWVTGGTAVKMAEEASVEAVVAVMTPYCVAQAKSAPNATEVMAALEAAKSYERRGIIEKAGWATPLGKEKPNDKLAVACSTALAST